MSEYEENPNVFGFWNNKGGTGKTSLTFQTACAFAQMRPTSKILVIDVCPQANLSELFLGGQENAGGRELIKCHTRNSDQRISIGGYFSERLPNPFTSEFRVEYQKFIIRVSETNNKVPDNLYLMPGDPILELQANAIATLANTQLPEINSWARVVKWLRSFIEGCCEDYDYFFVDMNPSFSMYTQIALAACHRLILPVTADDSSRRGIQNALSLISGVNVPSEVYKKHNFSEKMTDANYRKPKFHLIVKNRMTQYVKSAKAYVAVLSSIDSDIEEAKK